MIREAPECFAKLTALMTGKARLAALADAEAADDALAELRAQWMWVGEEAARLGGSVAVLHRDIYGTGIVPSVVIKVCDHLLCAPQGVQLQLPVTPTELVALRSLAEQHPSWFKIHS